MYVAVPVSVGRTGLTQQADADDAAGQTRRQPEVDQQSDDRHRHSKDRRHDRSERQGVHVETGEVDDAAGGRVISGSVQPASNVSPLVDDSTTSRPTPRITPYTSTASVSSLNHVSTHSRPSSASVLPSTSDLSNESAESSCFNSPEMKTTTPAHNIDDAKDMDDDAHDDAGEADDDDDEVDSSSLLSSECTDDIQDAMAKTALSTVLFSLTRANRVPINYANTLSKAMCNSSATLREFERVRLEVEAIEREAALAESLLPPPPAKSFFRRAPKPVPSPMAIAKHRTDEIMWTWVRGKMEALMSAQEQRRENAIAPSGIHSHSTPNLQHLLVPAVAAAPSPNGSARPSNAGGARLPPSFLPTPFNSSAPQTRSSSFMSPPGGGIDIVLPASTPHSPILHSASFTAYVPGQTPLASTPSASGASTPREGSSRFSPRRLWRTLFYTGASSSSAAAAAGLASQTTSGAATPIVSPAALAADKLSVAAVVQAPHTQHFDNFPRLSEVLTDLARASLPLSARAWTRGQHTRRRESAFSPKSVSLSQHSASQLVLHTCFPLPVPDPLATLSLSEYEADDEQHLFATWRDVLLNYRKHIPNRPAGGDGGGGSPQQVLLRWLIETWQCDAVPGSSTGLVQDDAAADAAVEAPEPDSMPLSPASPPMPLLLLDAPDDDDVSPPELPAVAPLSSTSAALPFTSPLRIRLLLLLQQWIFLCPFDFTADAACAREADDFLHRVQAQLTPPGASSAHPLDTLLRAMTHSLSEPASATALHSALIPPASALSSPLVVLPYPFTAEVDAVYSSNLFSYSPVDLARELTMHAHQLFRRIPIEEWLDGAWQTKGAAANAQEEDQQAYENEYSRANDAAAAGAHNDDATAEPAVGSASSTPPPSITASLSTHARVLISDFNRLVYWLMTEILHPRLTPRSRLDVVLYFLELGVVSLKVHRNFHVAFAVAAAFAAQPVYRLAEVRALGTMEERYKNERVDVQRIVETEANASSENADDGSAAARSPTLSSTASTPTHSATAPSSVHHQPRVRSQYEELKSVTSSRGNYATYRALIARILDEHDADADARAASSSTRGSSAHSTADSSMASTPRLWPQSAPDVRSSPSESDAAAVDPTTPLFPSASCRFDSTLEFPSSLSFGTPAASPTMNDGAGWPTNASATAAARAPLLIPHLAVHLKDLTYSQELSGVEMQWRDEKPTEQEAGAENEAPDSRPPAAVTPALRFRFDRSRWRRTSRLVCHLLRLQRLPVFPALLRAHSPPLYTLLQVHLLTHVLPEAELRQLSFALCPRVDRVKMKQAQQQKQALSALQEEGLI